MNKKFLVSSIVASSLAVALIASPKISLNSASIGLKNDALSSSVYNVEGKTLSVILPSTNYRLTKKDLVKLLKSNNVEVLKVFKADGKEVNGEDDVIGTGCEIELSNHKKITLVVYGDTTGDGKINNIDAQKILEGNLKTEAQKKAGNVKASGTNNIDAQRILEYSVGTFSKAEIVDEDIYKSDESNVVFDLNKSDVKDPEIEDTPNNEVQDNNIGEEQETPNVDNENNTTDNNSNEVEDNETTNPEEQGGLDDPNMSNPEVNAPETSEPEVNDPSAHKHSIDSWEISEKATCKSQGVRTGKCSVCGKVVTENYIDPNAHETVKIDDVPATCETSGKTNCSRCTLCGQEFYTKTAPLGHLYSNEFTTDTEPTCVNDGVKSKHCTREGCTSVTDKTTIKATGHNLVDVVEKATCTTDGTTTEKCTKCDYVGKPVVTSKAKGHQYSAYQSDNNATCKLDGTKSATCSVCGHKDTIQDKGSKLEHNFVTLTDKINATCISNGRAEVKQCLNCGEKKGGETIPALGHEFVLMSNSHDHLEGEEYSPKCIRCRCYMDFSSGNVKFGTGHQWNAETGSCICGDETCTENSAWWNAWHNNDKKYSAIWFVGFKCSLDECIGFDGRGPTYGQKVDVVIEGRRGNVKNIQMKAPDAKEGYVFDGWYEITDYNDGNKVGTTKETEDSTYVSSDGKTITVGWEDIYKGFEARYKKAEE